MRSNDKLHHGHSKRSQRLSLNIRIHTYLLLVQSAKRDRQNSLQQLQGSKCSRSNEIPRKKHGGMGVDLEKARWCPSSRSTEFKLPVTSPCQRRHRDMARSGSSRGGRQRCRPSRRCCPETSIPSSIRKRRSIARGYISFPNGRGCRSA